MTSCLMKQCLLILFLALSLPVLANDPAIKKELLASPTYYDAAIISKRIKVAGIDNLTPEMVLDLEGDDGDTLAQAMMDLDQRRAEFRSTQQAAPKAADSPA